MIYYQVLPDEQADDGSSATNQVIFVSIYKSLPTFSYNWSIRLPVRSRSYTRGVDDTANVQIQQYSQITGCERVFRHVESKSGFGFGLALLLHGF